MTTPNGLDPRLTDWLMAQAPNRAPDALLAEVRERAARTRRRPAWATSERWISMETRAQLGALPRMGVLLAILLSLLLLATAIAFAAGTSPAPKLPPPYGPAANGLIAYGYLGDIWLIGEDGSDPQQLTSGPELDFTGVWSPDGTTLAYWSAEFDGDPTNVNQVAAAGNGGDLSLKAISPGDPEPRTLATGLAWTGRGGIDIAWSPDSKQIAFGYRDVLDAGTLPRIDIVSLADGQRRPLVQNGVTPRWSPNGSAVAFVNLAYGTDPDGKATSQFGISVVPSDGGDPSPVSRVRGDDWSFLDPQWSSDGQRILFHAGTSFTDDIYIAQADGTGETRVTDTTLTERFPSWSPANDRIVYYRAGPSDGSRLVLSAPDGTDEVVFDHTRTGYRMPVWSPDGMRVLGVISDGAGRYIGLTLFDAADAMPPVTIPMELPDLITGDPTWQRLAP